MILNDCVRLFCRVNEVVAATTVNAPCTLGAKKNCILS
jgi:hypothetical protein